MKNDLQSQTLALTPALEKLANLRATELLLCPEQTNAAGPRVVSPWVGAKYCPGGVFLLNVPQSPASVEHFRTAIENSPAELFSHHTQRGIIHPLLYGVAATLVGRYVVDRPDWRAIVDVALREDALDLLGSNSPAAAALEHIALGSACPEFESLPRGRESTTALSKKDAERTYVTFWYSEILRAYLEVLRPFYVIVLGGRYTAWEVATQSLGCEAWIRETNQTPVGHILALKNRELFSEVVFLDLLDEYGALTVDGALAFFQFVEGGFLLGGQDFELVSRRPDA